MSLMLRLPGEDFDQIFWSARPMSRGPERMALKRRGTGLIGSACN